MSTTNETPLKSWQRTLEAAEEEDAQAQEKRSTSIPTDQSSLTHRENQALMAFRRAVLRAREALKARTPDRDLVALRGLSDPIETLIQLSAPESETDQYIPDMKVCLLPRRNRMMTTRMNQRNHLNRKCH